MELEGFGASLVGKRVWCVGDVLLPWEFLHADTHAMRILVQPGIRTACLSARVAEAEADWNCVWSPTSAHDWSCIATLIRSAGSKGGVLLVLDHWMEAVPPSFLHYLEGLLRSGGGVTLVWLSDTHTAPPWHIGDTDAIVFAPMGADVAAQTHTWIQHLPARRGHGPFVYSAEEWETVCEATRLQDLGLVVSDVGEQTWGLFWHRPSDSRGTKDDRIRRSLAWIDTGTHLLRGV